MDRETDEVIDLLMRVSRSALASLDAVVDVDRRWRELRPETGAEPPDENRDGDAQK
jgi:hypothetical protein